MITENTLEVAPPTVKARPIRVLFIIDSLASCGGAELALLRLTQSLPKDQFDCRLLTFHLAEELREQCGCPLEHWQLDSVIGPKAITVAQKLRKLVREQEIDVVHTVFQTADLWAGPIAKSAGAKVLISSRRDMGILRKRQHIIGYRLLAGVFDQVQCVSESVRQFTLRQDHVEPGRTVTVYNGVPASPPISVEEVGKLRQEIGIPDGVPVVTAVASFRRVKGIDVLVKAAALIKEEVPDARIIVAGHFGLIPDDKAFREEVEQLRKTLGIDDMISFIGETSQVRALLTLTDVFVLPSRSEGLSNALLEAMEAGVPCVATAVGGNPEVIVEGETGFLVPPEDPPALARQILALLRDPGRRRQMGVSGRNRLLERFTQVKMTSQVQAAYHYALERRRWETSEPKAYRSTRAALAVSLGMQKLASRSGFNAVLRSVLLRNHFLVLCYHGVLRRRPKHWSSHVINVMVDQFEDQMKFLSKHFHLVSGEELSEIQQGRRSLQPRSAMVTFDDGYENNLTVAAPILRAYGIPATFFVSTGYIGQERLLWPDEVFLRVMEWPESMIPLAGGGFLGLPKEPERRMQVAESIRESCKFIAHQTVTDYLEILRAGGSLPTDSAREEVYRFMDWNQVRELQRQGFEIGSHSVTHPILSRCSREQVEWELRESKIKIEREIGGECRKVAFPNGLLRDTGKPVWELAEEAGYETGFMLERGLSSLRTPIAINRINIPGEEAPAVFESRAAGVYVFR